MADIKQIKLPDGSVLNLKDATARDQMENKSNKTTVLNSSSTDSEYPSAKAVYDLVQSAGAAAVQYIFLDTDSNGNIVITEQIVGSLDSTNF